MDNRWQLSLQRTQLPEAGQAGVGHCESGTVQLSEVFEPSDVREQLIGPAVVQIGEDDVAEIIDSFLIDDPFAPRRFPFPRVRAIVPFGVMTTQTRA
jgi:hypothetical protein